MKTTTSCAVMVDEHGQILAWTSETTIQACEEYLREFYGDKFFERLIQLGNRIVQAEITIIPPGR